MKSKHKLLLIKFSISVTGIFFVTAFILKGISAYILKSNLYRQLYENRSNACFLAFAASATIMILLMNHMKITPERVKSTKLKIKYRDYEKINEWIEQQLKNDGYGEIQEYDGYSYKIRYAYQRNLDIVYLIMMIREEEMTEEMYQGYDEARFEKLGNYLLENKIVREDDSIYMTFIICVDRTNKYFSKYTETDIEQFPRQYSLPIGISLASKTLYIGTQEEGMYKGAYKKLKKKFQTYLEPILEDTKK